MCLAMHLRSQTVPAGGPQGGRWDGPYRPIAPDANSDNPWHSCCEIAHAVLIGKPGPTQGKVLIIQGNGARWIWDPASPNSVSLDTFNENHVDNLFCSCHSVDGQGDIVVHGGTREWPGVNPPACPTTPVCDPLVPAPSSNCGPQPKWSYVYDPTTMAWSGDYPLRVPVYHNPPANFRNLGFYYSGSLRLPDGRVLSAGGGSSPLTTYNPNNNCCDCGDNYFVNGWQYFDPSHPGGPRWIGNGVGYFDGLSGGPLSPAERYEFNFYPLLTLMPGSAPGSAFVFAPTVTNDRKGNFADFGFAAVVAPTASMSLATPLGGSAWQVHASTMLVPGTTTSRNLLYPNGFLWPLELDSQGLLPATAIRRFVVLGGCDFNDYLSGAAGATSYGVPLHPDGGRRTMPQVYTIDNPGVGTGTWSSSLLPGPNFPRIYSNTVLLPDRKAFLVGGATFDFLPFAGQGAPVVRNRERKAAPVLLPEMLDLQDPTGWAVCEPHVSPRLYHSVALLLPDARVLVGGGYRGKKNVSSTEPYPELPPVDPEHHTWADWRLQHSNFEIYSPDYLLQGKRPEIQLLQSSEWGYGEEYEIAVHLPGSSQPALEIGSVCLMSPGSVTHHYDWDQRYVGLHHSTSASHPDHRIVISMPASANLAAPGWYMLFVVTNGTATDGMRIPSVAKFIRLQ
jgi:Domain of unknown function (DUF1929)